MQGEKGSLLELQRYHRSHGSISPRITPPPASEREEPSPLEEEEGEEEEDPASESNLRALRAIQARLLAGAAAACGVGHAAPQPIPRPRGGRRHTLANLSR